MILCIGTTPAAQRVMVFQGLAIDQVNRAVRTVDGAAGKSINVAKVLQVLGAKPLATGFLGGNHGEQLRAILQGRGLNMEFISVSAPTRQCITVIDELAGTITELVEESRPVDPAEYEKLWEIISLRLPHCQAVVMSGTIASGGPTDFYFRCAQLAREAGVLSVVDASGAPLREALKAGPDLVKPNRAELEATLGQALGEEQQILDAMRKLHSQGARRVVVTAGSEPVLAFDGDCSWKVTGPTVAALNPIGSGDAFTAALTWRWVEGDTLGEACRWASATGGANALTLMAGEVNRPDIDALLPQVRVERLDC